MSLCGYCLVRNPFLCTRASYIYHLVSLFGSLVQLSDKRRGLSGICCQATWTGRQQQLHYERSLRRDLASSQKTGKECTIAAETREYNEDMRKGYPSTAVS